MQDPTRLLPELEHRLLDPAIRSNPAKAGKLLAEDFREFGSSGRIWSRSEILAHLAAEPPGHLEASHFEVTLLTPELALVTYRSTWFRDGAPPRQALRSSLWRLEDSQWRVFFHQGTLIPGAD
jgi:hypothetical protein